MLTRYGHAWSAYLLFLLALSHWLDARRLTDEEQATKTSETAPD